ncbi:hypothetical protein O3P69_019688 [Scylla paramamosain]|uniref:Uncharacterized protein n=1 Tax=Scylla paramamosain TaxID=85552 RepID=A0AAW0SXZ2_SCYPA
MKQCGDCWGVTTLSRPPRKNDSPFPPSLSLPPSPLPERAPAQRFTPPLLVPAGGAQRPALPSRHTATLQADGAAGRPGHHADARLTTAAPGRDRQGAGTEAGGRVRGRQGTGSKDKGQRQGDKDRDRDRDRDKDRGKRAVLSGPGVRHTRGPSRLSQTTGRGTGLWGRRRGRGGVARAGQGTVRLVQGRVGRGGAGQGQGQGRAQGTHGTLRGRSDSTHSDSGAAAAQLPGYWGPEDYSTAQPSDSQ